MKSNTVAQPNEEHSIGSDDVNDDDKEGSVNEESEEVPAEEHWSDLNPRTVQPVKVRRDKETGVQICKALRVEDTTTGNPDGSGYKLRKIKKNTVVMIQADSEDDKQAIVKPFIALVNEVFSEQQGGEVVWCLAVTYLFRPDDLPEQVRPRHKHLPNSTALVGLTHAGTGDSSPRTQVLRERSRDREVFLSNMTARDVLAAWVMHPVKVHFLPTSDISDVEVVLKGEGGEDVTVLRDGFICRRFYDKDAVKLYWLEEVAAGELPDEAQQVQELLQRTQQALQEPPPPKRLPPRVHLHQQITKLKHLAK